MSAARAPETAGLPPSQEPFNGREAFSDFILLIYEAMSISGGGGPGAARSSGGSFVYSVR